MATLTELYAAQAFWIWVVLAAALLALEVSTGSGWLLWPSASAALVAVVVYVTHPSPVAAVLVFAGVTIVTTLLARRYLRRPPHDTHDINDNVGRLVGARGKAVADFDHGSGRVFIDGKEWAAELEDGETLAAGARVKVTGVAGAHLKVTAA